YIHLIRHGLDMALSKQKEGVFLWGHIFGIGPPSFEDLPKKMLQFWYIVNKGILSWGKEVMNDRFFLLNFDQFCIDPEKELIRLTSFLELSCSEEKINRLAKIPKLPTSCGRYKEKAEIFSRSDIEMVREFGFTVE
ncbi:MAG: hypothetical protein D6726_00485, partial [Nitrospirae bacterium]